MLWIDIVLAAAFVPGSFLAAMYLFGYMRDRQAKALVLGVIAFVLSVLPCVVLTYYATGFLEGEVPVWGLVFAAPVSLFVIIAVLRAVLFGPGKGDERGGGGGRA